MTPTIEAAAPTAHAVVLPAHLAALQWLNAFVAASTEEERPVLYRTVCVEVFARGVQFVACDGFCLFRTWVPFADDVAAPMPELEEVPELTAIVRDAEGFAKAFLRTVLSSTRESPEVTLTMTIAPRPDEHEPPLGEPLWRYGLTLSAVDQELHCGLFEDRYPNWRALDLGVSAAERVDGLKVARRMFAKVAALKAVDAVELTFTGEQRAVGFASLRSDVQVRGFFMPMRRADDAAPEDTAAEDTTDA